MKAPLLPLLLLFVVAACHCDKNEPQPTQYCGVVNPVENLPWLKATIDDFENNRSGFGVYQYVQQSTYQGNTVFIFGNCCPFCDSIFLVKDCEGHAVDITAAAVDGPTTVIWKPENSLCVFTQD